VAARSEPRPLSRSLTRTRCGEVKRTTSGARLRVCALQIIESAGCLLFRDPAHGTVRRGPLSWGGASGAWEERRSATTKRSERWGAKTNIDADPRPRARASGELRQSLRERQRVARGGERMSPRALRGRGGGRIGWVSARGRIARLPHSLTRFARSFAVTLARNSPPYLLLLARARRAPPSPTEPPGKAQLAPTPLASSPRARASGGSGYFLSGRPRVRGAARPGKRYRAPRAKRIYQRYRKRDLRSSLQGLGPPQCYELGPPRREG